MQLTNSSPTPPPSPTPSPSPSPPPADTFRDDFEGTALDTSKWTAGNWFGPSISLSVANGSVTVGDFCYLRSNQAWFQKTVEAVINLGNNSHFGLANTLHDVNSRSMIFTVSNGIVWARTRLDDGQLEINTPLSDIQLDVPHHWKIVWNTDNSIQFWVDDVLKTTHTRAFNEPLYIFLSAGRDLSLTADSVQLSTGINEVHGT